jgi:hypothetical protein
MGDLAASFRVNRSIIGLIVGMAYENKMAPTTETYRAVTRPG